MGRHELQLQAFFSDRGAWPVIVFINDCGDVVKRPHGIQYRFKGLGFRVFSLVNNDIGRRVGGSSCAFEGNARG